MTEQFFDKELAARKIEAIPGLMEFDIPAAYAGVTVAQMVVSMRQNTMLKFKIILDGSPFSPLSCADFFPAVVSFIKLSSFFI